MTDIPVAAGGTSPAAAPLFILFCGQQNHQRDPENHRKEQKPFHIRTSRYFFSIISQPGLVFVNEG